MNSDNLQVPQSVSWRYDQETQVGEGTVVSGYGETFDGTVKGMRAHNDWFKFSVLYKDEFSSKSEITIFYAVGSFRMGEIHYDEVGGELYLASMSGFVEANCVVQ